MEAEVVGDPLGSWRTDPSEAFARNLWDLRAYEGRLYIGYGDAIVNTGPTAVISYDPARKDFTRETVLQEEAILRYRVFDDELYVPGADAVGSDDGALYVRNGVGWRTIPVQGAVHVNDVWVRGDELCLALQDRQVGGVVRYTHDEARTWNSMPTGSWRAVSLFSLGATLYVSSHDSGVRQVRGGQVDFKIPGAPADALVASPTACGPDVVFIAKRIVYVGDSANVETFGAYRASQGPDGRADIARIDVAGTAIDVFSDDRGCYLLTSDALSSGRFQSAIYASRDARTWKRQVVVEEDALVRSAERMDGYFYLGLGCDAGHCTSAAGRLLRVAAPDLR